MAQRHRYLDLDTLNAPCSLIRPRSIEYQNLIPFEKKEIITQIVCFSNLCGLSISRALSARNTFVLGENENEQQQQKQKGRLYNQH